MITFLFFFASSHQRYLWWLHASYFANTVCTAGLTDRCVALWDYLLPSDDKENHGDSFYPQYLQVNDDSPEPTQTSHQNI